MKKLAQLWVYLVIRPAGRYIDRRNRAIFGEDD